MIRPLMMIVLCAMAAFVHTGCATIMSGSEQTVTFSSDPAGAIVSVDGVPSGTTPVVIPIKRSGGSKQIMFEKPGYKTTTMTLKGKLNPAVLGNILIGGVVGLAVDAVSGGSNSYDDSVIVVLERGKGVISLDDLKPAPSLASRPRSGPFGGTTHGPTGSETSSVTSVTPVTSTATVTRPPPAQRSAAPRTSVSETLVGIWNDPSPTQGGTIVIFERDGRPVFRKTLRDGGELTRKVVASREGSARRYDVVGSSKGEYYVISADGTLHIRDAGGLIALARKTH